MFFASCTLEIDLKKIANNYQVLRSLCENAELAIALKADAYGLDAKKIAPILISQGCKNFFVARLAEGLELREVAPTANIYILDGIFADEADYFHNYKLIPILNHLAQVEIWRKANLKHTLPYGLHVDTGMHRLGMPLEEFEQLILNKYVIKQHPPALIISHLCAGTELECAQSRKQLTMFNQIRQHFPYSKASLANSAGLFLGTEYHFDMVRVGIALYGASDDSKIALAQSIHLSAPIIQLKNLKSAHTIGYGMTFSTKYDSIIATIPIGYADGYAREFSNKGQVYIGGKYANVVGRVSMDVVTVDVTHIAPENLYIGADVEIIGPHCSPGKLAMQINTINYEIITSLGKRHKRVYKY